MRAAAIFTALLAVTGCKTDEEECEEARVLAEQAWGGLVDVHEKTLAASVAAQAEAVTRLVTHVEPRFSDAAERAASARYDRSSDAWQRAYEASKNAACAADAECGRLKRENAEAKDLQEDLKQKLEVERAALRAVRKTPEEMKQAAAVVVPEVENPAIGDAKKASEAAYVACKDVKPAPKPSE